MHNALHALCPFALRKCPSLKMTLLSMPFIKISFRKCPLRMPFQICPSSKCPFGNANSNMPIQICHFKNALSKMPFLILPYLKLPCLNLPFIKLLFITNAIFSFISDCEILNSEIMKRSQLSGKLSQFCHYLTH